MNWRERIILLLLAAINFTHILDFMVMMPLGNFLMPFFNITPQEFSVVVASYSLSAFVSGLIAAFFVDRFDRKKVLLFGYIGFTVGTICCGIAPNYILLLTARIVAGLFGGLIGAQVLSIVADTFPYERRGQAMGILISAFSVASIVGVPFALFLAEGFSWHAPFLFIGLLGIIIIPFISKYLPAMNKHVHASAERVKPMEMVKGILNNKQQRRALLLSGGLMLGHFLIIPFLNPFMELNVGFTSMQRNLVYMVGGICSFFSAPLIGKLADKYGKHKVFYIFAIVSLIPVFLITNMPPIKYYFVLTVTGIWFALTTGRTIPAQAIISNVVPAEQRGSFMSFNSSFQQMFTGLASLIAGFIVIEGADNKIHNYPIVGYLSIAVIFGCIFIAKAIYIQPATDKAVEPVKE
jgi:predicted MFS family arabinose efflux permease